MIVIDTSALIAILDQEPDHARFAAAMDDADTCVLSALTVNEASIVMLAKHGTSGIQDLRRLLVAIDAEILPFADVDGILAAA